MLPRCEYGVQLSEDQSRRAPRVEDSQLIGSENLRGAEIEVSIIILRVIRIDKCERENGLSTIFRADFFTISIEELVCLNNKYISH